MPLLMCPNCNGSMQQVNRDEVQIDMCPACRGVWLDRGELEKLLVGVKDERQQAQTERERFAQDRDQFYRDPDSYRRSHPQPRPYKYDDDDDDYRYGHKRKKKGFDIFDIFD
jgi:Zn-finger nucleic acid-binding protein